MVKPIREKNRDWLKEELARIEREHPVIDTKWAVEEVRPAYDTGGYYSQYVPEESNRVSPHFDTREEAEEWRSKHEADDGKYLALAKYTVREYRHVKWSSFRIRD